MISQDGVNGLFQIGLNLIIIELENFSSRNSFHSKKRSFMRQNQGRQRQDGPH